MDPVHVPHENELLPGAASTSSDALSPRSVEVPRVWARRLKPRRRGARRGGRGSSLRPGSRRWLPAFAVGSSGCPRRGRVSEQLPREVGDAVDLGLLVLVRLVRDLRGLAHRDRALQDRAIEEGRSTVRRRRPRRTPRRLRSVSARCNRGERGRRRRSGEGAGASWRVALIAFWRPSATA